MSNKTPEWNIGFTQGTTYTPSIQYNDPTNQPIDLSGASADMQVRASWDSGLILLELSTANGRIVLNNPQGNIQLSFLPGDTSTLTFTGQTPQNFPEVGYGFLWGYYDLMLNLSGQVSQLVKGKILLAPAITRPSS